MSNFSILTPSEQVAEYLRYELFKGRWSKTMPGAPALAKELEVDPKSVTLALNHLEKKGLLAGQGPGRPRKITLPEDEVSSSFRVGLLDLDSHPRDRRLTEDLKQLPYTVVISPKTLLELKMDVRRVARHVKSMDVDAWIVYSGSRDVLEWFSQQNFPTLALFGYMSLFQIAGVGPDSPRGCAESVHALAALGHQRIVLLIQKHFRHPEPTRVVSVFMESLEAEGIQASPYNLPDWDEGEGGFKAMLESLFKVTPPTALVISDKMIFFAVQQFLLEKGIRVPGDVSLVCHEFIPASVWSKASVASINWDWKPITRRIRSWTKNVSQGKEDTRQYFIKPAFVSGKTLEPPSSRR